MSLQCVRSESLLERLFVDLSSNGNYHMWLAVSWIQGRVTYFLEDFCWQSETVNGDFLVFNHVLGFQRGIFGCLGHACSLVTVSVWLIGEEV